MNYSVFTSHYFTDWILTATTLVSLVISWKHRKHKQLFLIQIYIIASLFIDVLSSITELLFPNNKLWLDMDCVAFNLFSILEMSVIFLFITKKIYKRKTRYILKILYSSYIILCVVTWMSFPVAIISNIPYLFGFEGIIISILCLSYFYDLMQSPLLEKIWRIPDFWVVSGLLLYFSTTCPFYWALDGLKYTPIIDVTFTSINYCLYTILFIAFIKAFLCPIRIQK
jgi:hypothetical protein